MTSDEAIKKLKKDYCIQYDKNYNIFSEINDKIDFAIDNAKKLEEHHLHDNKNVKMVEANPHSEMYKLIEEFRN